jgi:nicotinate-nucleotide--dimethylbenzimidazole phosphoribosyltransferase
VGAGPLPVDEHRRRPPIPIVPADARARADALARGADEYDAWRASVSHTGRAIVADGAPPEPLRDAPGMTVGEVALAVDTGREVAARAAAGGVGVLVARAPAGHDDTAARMVAETLAAGGEHGPLGTLRRLGDATTAVLCGVALGAGEHGLGCVCDGVEAVAAAAVAAGIEPGLLPRLVAVRGPATDALAARLGIATIEAGPA